jgi:DNA-binding IscR family transcriptional regulator
MTPYKIRVYETLRRLFNENLSYVPTHKIIAALGGNTRRIYRALEYLESKNIIERRSKRGGWRPAVLASCIYGALLHAYRLSHEFVQTEIIARHLNQNPRIIRGELSKLEQARVVHRHNQRGGWQPARQPQAPTSEQIILTLEDLFIKQQKPQSTETIAKRLRISERHARRLLADYERQGVVARASRRGGWQLLSPSADRLMMVAH